MTEKLNRLGMLRIMQKHPSAPVFLWAATLFLKRKKVSIVRTFLF